MKKKQQSVAPWITSDGLFLLECWARDGVKEIEIAARMGVLPQTLSRWKQQHPEMAKALSRGKEIVDYQVENALLKAALGYSYTEVKTYINGDADKNGNRKVRIEKVEKQQGPNVTACLAWLNNRKSNEWRRNRDNVIEIEDADHKITVNVIKHTKDMDEKYEEAEIEN